MKKTIASVALSLALMSSAAMANDRADNSVSGALSKIGHAAHTLVGYIAKPFTARSRGSRRSSATQQAQRATVAGPSSHVADSPPAPRSQTDAPTVPPSTPGVHPLFRQSSPWSEVIKQSPFGPQCKRHWTDEERSLATYFRFQY